MKLSCSLGKINLCMYCKTFPLTTSTFTFSSNCTSQHITGCKPVSFGWVILEAVEYKLYMVGTCHLRLTLVHLDPVARNWFYRYEGKLPTLRKVPCVFEMKSSVCDKFI